MALQYSLMITGNPDMGVAELTLNFFSFFTVLTNILIALAMTLPLLTGAAARFGTRPGFRTAVTLYAVIVGLVYHFLLHATWSPQGWSLIVNIGLHYVMPIAMLIDWLMFTPRHRHRWIDAVIWLSFPLAFGVWTVIHGQITGWYPYWFINIGQLGWARAGFNFTGLLIVFSIAGLVFIALDRALSPRDRRKWAP